MPNILAATLTANGNSQVFSIPTGLDTTSHTPVALTIPSGTFGSGTVTLEVQVVPGGAWIPTGLFLTAAGQRVGYAYGVNMRVNLAGATSPSLATIFVDTPNATSDALYRAPTVTLN